MASSPPNPVSSAWFPGDAAVGSEVHSVPQIFSRPVVMQQGMATGVNGAVPPSVTAPGTVASAGTVTNGTGYDCMVYLSATTGIQKIVYPQYGAGGTIAGTTPAAQTSDIYVPNNVQIAVTYTGTLTWTWLAI